VSDIALKKELPVELARSAAALVGCVAGALPMATYERMLREAGFAAVQIVDTKSDLNAYSKVEGASGCCTPSMEAPKPSGPALPVTEEEWIASSQGCCGTETETSRSCCSSEPPTLHDGLAEIIGRYNVNDYAASVRVFAVKP
jgi:hypothetical protein